MIGEIAVLVDGENVGDFAELGSDELVTLVRNRLHRASA